MLLYLNLKINSSPIVSHNLKLFKNVIKNPKMLNLKL